MIHAVIADDEPLARLRLRTLLADHPDVAVVAECADGTDAVEVIRRERPDLVFLDVQMAELDGVAVARTLAGPDAPAVVFVTAFAQYAVPAFGVRALDYLLKPFDEERFASTLQRVRGHLADVQTRQAHARLLEALGELARGGVAPARGGPAPRQSLRVADLELDPRARTVARAGVLVPLRPKEWDLLFALVKRAGDVVTRRTLLEEVWGYRSDVVSRTIDTHVAEVRRKLGYLPGEPGYIVTVARTGYRLQL